MSFQRIVESVIIYARMGHSATAQQPALTRWATMDSSKTSTGTAPTNIVTLDAIEHRCDVSGNWGTPTAHGNTAATRDVAQFLCGQPVDPGVDPSVHGRCDVRSAAAQGRLDVVRYLCELPVDRGVARLADATDAVRRAAENGHLGVVRYLCELPVDRGVDPSVDDNSAVASAATSGHLDVVRYLCELPVDRGVDPSAVAGMLAEDSIRVRSCTARYLRSTYCRGLRLWSRSPVEGIRQEALASLARSPLLVIRAMVRQRRAVRL